MYFNKLLPALAFVLVLPLLSNCSFETSPQQGDGRLDPRDGGLEQGEDRQGPPPWAPAHGYRAKHRYTYWPNSEIYRDDSRGTYFYYENGGWRSGAKLPGRFKTVGDSVILEMDDDMPYKWHDKVKNKHPRHKPK